jgi:hypothetical protein
LSFFKKVTLNLKNGLPFEVGLNATKTKIGLLFYLTLLQMTREFRKEDGCSNAASPPCGWRIFIEDYGERGRVEGRRV